MRLGPIAIGEPRLTKSERSFYVAASRAMVARQDFAPAPTPATRRPSLLEIGATGQNIMGGRLGLTDYNPELQPPQSYLTFDKMRKSDGQVRAALSVIKLPLLSVDWRIEAASDDPRDLEIAQWLDKKFDDMTITKSSFLRQAMLMLDYGSMPFESVWQVGEDGLIELRKLAPRMPNTVMDWNVDENGGLAGITQTASKASSIEYVFIPVEKLLVFVNEQEGSDYHGTSVLRAAYKHWFYKDNLYRIDAIGKERRSIGVDVGSFEGTEVDDADRARLESALMGLHAHEKQFFIEQKGRYTYRVEGTGDVVSAMESIEHHDTRILRSVLAEFLAMGEGSTGSLAMHKDKSSFFIMALEAVATNICETFNRHLLRRWVDYNWTVDDYPKLVHSRLDTRNITELADAVSKFVTAGVLTVEPMLEDEIRETLDLPELPEDFVPPLPLLPMPDDEPMPGDEPEMNPVAAARKRKRAMPRKRWGFGRVSFADLERTLDRAEASIIASVKSSQRKQVDALVREALKALRNDDLDKLADIDVPFKGQLAQDIADVLLDVYKDGHESVRSELGESSASSNALDLNPQAIKSFLLTRARGVVNVVADKLKSALVWNAQDQYRDNAIDEAKLKQSLTALSDREIRKIAGNTVSEALNLGRDEAALSTKRKLTATFSSVMDRNTCNPCVSADGKEVEVGSKEYFALRPPYRECHGHSRCRCIYVYNEGDKR